MNKKNMPLRYSLIASLFAFVLLSGCVRNIANYEPVIDRKDVDWNAYRADLEECRLYAGETDFVGDTVIHGVAGAGLGAALGAATQTSASFGATTGGVTGTSLGLSRSYREQRSIVKKCLKGRGYKVLG